MASGTIEVNGLQQTLGARVDISSYTSDYYTFPSDGYIECNAGAVSNAQASARIFGNSGNNYFQLGGIGNGTYSSWSCAVRKGMRAKVVLLQNTGKVYFSPLT